MAMKLLLMIIYSGPFLGTPVIMILDEAASALDSESEHYIKEALYALKYGWKARTIIIISTQFRVGEPLEDRLVKIKAENQDGVKATQVDFAADIIPAMEPANAKDPTKKHKMLNV
ncbi:ABC transporter B family member 26, chloroplastic-like isoform X2 [Senna tora]|uniref:ABC transporter B family member 26, chloroplastic-like isoform X2 n=1 Tax=Senna tora TaxID=362788 RepID=A0A834T8J2_9FABA|nr:ABC transporter B family member 26, chloroplastic-like isoform X2 [Senna tora]